MKYPFEVISNATEQVVLKNLAKTPLDVAMHPYVSGNMEYFTITKGNDHIFTIIKDDGTSWSFTWGISGHTLVSDNVKKLRDAATEFVHTQGIALDVCTTMQPCKAEIFFAQMPSGDFWQINLEFYKSDVDHSKNIERCFIRKLNSEEEALAWAKNSFNESFSELEFINGASGWCGPRWETKAKTVKNLVR